MKKKIKVTALTKGVLPEALTDTKKYNEFGITLITLDEKVRKEIEPRAAPVSERIESLHKLKNAGTKTWVSIEPYPTPNIIDQNFGDILDTVGFVDKIIFGRMNYNKQVTAFKGYKQYYNALAAKTIDFCEKRKIGYHIKNGTVSK